MHKMTLGAKNVFCTFHFITACPQLSLSEDVTEVMAAAAPRRPRMHNTFSGLELKRPRKTLRWMEQMDT